MRKVFKGNLYFLIILLVQILGPYLLLPIFKKFNIVDIKLVLFLSHLILLIIPAIIYFIVTKANVKETLRLNKMKFGDVLLIILLGFICQPIMIFFSLITSLFFENNVGNLMTTIMDTPYIILLLLMAVMPAITEEVTIRGIVLSGYDKIDKYKAAIVTGLFFGILHLDGQQFLYAAALGFILALVVRITNSIFSGCLIHFIFNGTSITLQKIINLYPNEILNSTQQASDMSFASFPIWQKILVFGVYGVMAAGFGALVWVVLRYLQRRNPETIEINKSSDIAIKEERIINIPLIASIIVYLIYMVISIVMT